MKTIEMVPVSVYGKTVYVSELDRDRMKRVRDDHQVHAFSYALRNIDISFFLHGSTIV